MSKKKKTMITRTVVDQDSHRFDDILKAHRETYPDASVTTHWRTTSVEGNTIHFRVILVEEVK